MSGDTKEPGADRTIVAVGGVLPSAEPAPVTSLSMAAPPPLAPAHGTPGALVGLQLNDMFEITRFIAQGGMGEVYEGRNIASGERVAIKVILPQFASDQQFFALFKREASSLERIGHDALVKYRALAFDRASQLNYLAIEYVDGPPLSDVLDGTPASPEEVKRLLRRLAAGLGAAHELGVIHRDLSPDNVLLPEGRLERAKIIDFGIAKDTNPGEKSVVGDAFAGKFGYAAPEIFGKYGRAIGPWTDVYSLALVVLAVAKGRPLDMGVTIVDALEARDHVPDLSFLSPELQPLFTRMLEPDPAQRFASMEEVLAALDASSMPLFATVAPAPEPVATPAFVRADTTTAALPSAPRKRSLLLFGGVAAGVLAVVGSLLVATGDDEPEQPAPDAVNEALPPAGARLSWPEARVQIAQALAAVPCSDLRIAGDPTQPGVARITGWRPADATVPASVGGWQLDASTMATVPTPSRETCDVVARLHAVARAHEEFEMQPLQRVRYTELPTAPAGGFSVDLGLSGRPEGLSRLTLVSIDDRPVDGEQRIASADVDQFGLDLTSLEFERKPKRYLVALIGATNALPQISWPLEGAAMEAACSNDRCAVTMGWIEASP